jgi:hypothetical protein
MSKYGFFSKWKIDVCMSGVWHITVEWKIIDKFSKMLYQKNGNVLWKARYMLYFLITFQNMDLFLNEKLMYVALDKQNTYFNIQSYFQLYFLIGSGAFGK